MEEIDAGSVKCLHDNNTWDLAKNPKGSKVLKKKWVYQI